jgi:hypothetical protein
MCVFIAVTFGLRSFKFHGNVISTYYNGSGLYKAAVRNPFDRLGVWRDDQGTECSTTKCLEIPVRSDVDFHRKKPNLYCLEGAERRKCSRGNAHKCPIFVEMEEDGGE